MTRPDFSGSRRRRRVSQGGRMRPQAAGDLLSGALRSLGVPSVRVTSRLSAAWEAACEDGWRHQTVLRRLEGGVLEVGVRSAALRDELVNFHRARLLTVLRTALPDVPLIGVRFVSDVESDGDAR